MELTCAELYVEMVLFNIVMTKFIDETDCLSAYFFGLPILLGAEYF